MKKRLSLLCLSMAVLLIFGCDSATSPNGDDGDFWQKTSLSVNTIFSWEIGSDDYVFVGTSNENGPIFRSADNGETWEQANNGLGGDERIGFLAFNPDINYLFAGMGIYVFYSTDNGESWIRIDSFGPVSSIANISTLVSVNYGIFAGGPTNIIHGRMYTSYIDWGLAVQGVSTYSLAIHPERNNIFAATSNGVLRCDIEALIHTWEPWGLIGESVTSLVVDPQGQIFAATENDVFRFSNDSDWQTTGFNKEADCLAVNKNGDVFAGTAYEGIFCLSNNGEWEETNTGLVDDNGSLIRYIRCLGVDSKGYLYAGTGANGLFKSVKSTE